MTNKYNSNRIREPNILWLLRNGLVGVCSTNQTVELFANQNNVHRMLWLVFEFYNIIVTLDTLSPIREELKTK